MYQNCDCVHAPVFRLHSSSFLPLSSRLPAAWAHRRRVGAGPSLSPRRTGRAPTPPTEEGGGLGAGRPQTAAAGVQHQAGGVVGGADEEHWKKCIKL